MNDLTFTLASGRVILLKEPLTEEEKKVANTPEGMKIFELLADIIKERCKTEWKEGDPRYEAIKKNHEL